LPIPLDLFKPYLNSSPNGYGVIAGQKKRQEEK